MHVTYEIVIGYGDDYDGPVPTETDIEEAIRTGLSTTEVGKDIESIEAEKQ